MINRVLKSLFNVSSDSFKCNLQYKTITFFNLLMKSLHILGFSPRSINWKFSDCIINIKFNNLKLDFFCPKDKSFNRYMNPYFHEYDISTFIYHTLEEGDTFIDVGAMSGLYTIIAGKILGNKGNVISVEPNPECLQNLQKNNGLNNCINVTLLKKRL